MARRFIWEQPSWPDLRVDIGLLESSLSGLAFDQGQVAGALRSLGLAARAQVVIDTMVDTAVQTSQIEGEQISPESVRASLTRRLDMGTPGVLADRRADGIASMTAD